MTAPLAAVTELREELRRDIEFDKAAADGGDTYCGKRAAKSQEWLDALDQLLAERAADGVIFLPKAAFGKGTKFIASTLLEEHLHITKHLRDESRELQDWLFDRVVSLGEELMGEPL